VSPQRFNVSCEKFTGLEVMQQFGVHATLVGTLTGTALTLAVNNGSSDLLRTAVLEGGDALFFCGGVIWRISWG